MSGKLYCRKCRFWHACHRVGPSIFQDKLWKNSTVPQQHPKSVWKNSTHLTIPQNYIICKTMYINIFTNNRFFGTFLAISFIREHRHSFLFSSFSPGTRIYQRESQSRTYTDRYTTPFSLCSLTSLNLPTQYPMVKRSR